MKVVEYKVGCINCDQKDPLWRIIGWEPPGIKSNDAAVECVNCGQRYAVKLVMKAKMRNPVTKR